MYILILVLLIIIYIVKYLMNKETMENNCKDENDIANEKYARKYYAKTKTSYAAIIFAIGMIIILIICQYTDIDKAIIDYISTEFYEEKKFDTSLYFIPIYILVMRSIVIEVKLSEYLYKYFKVEEPQLEENPLKNILYKKKQGQGEIPKDKEKTEQQEQPQIETLEATNIELPQETQEDVNQQ